MDGRVCLSRDVKFARDAGKCQDIIILVEHLFRKKLLPFLADLVKPSVIDEQVITEGRLLVRFGDTGFEAGVRRLDVSVSMVDADDGQFFVVDHYIFHNPNPFCPYGRKKAACMIADCLLQMVCVVAAAILFTLLRTRSLFRPPPWRVLPESLLP